MRVLEKNQDVVKADNNKKNKIKFLRTSLTRARKKAGTFVRTNSIARHLKYPRWVLKAVFHLLPS